MLSTSDLHLKFDVLLVVCAGHRQLASNRPRLHLGSGAIRNGCSCKLNRGAVAQLGERLICIQEVAGSIPTSSTSFHHRSFLLCVIFATLAKDQRQRTIRGMEAARRTWACS